MKPAFLMPSSCILHPGPFNLHDTNITLDTSPLQECAFASWLSEPAVAGMKNAKLPLRWKPEFRLKLQGIGNIMINTMKDLLADQLIRETEELISELNDPMVGDAAVSPVLNDNTD